MILDEGLRECLCALCTNLVVANSDARQGIIDSGAVIIFLSEGILSRPFCQYEVRSYRHTHTPV